MPLPRHPVEPLGLWQLRVCWGWLGESFHPTTADPDRSAGLSCHTAVPPASGPAVTARMYRRPYERLGRRWSPPGLEQRSVSRLVRAHLDQAQPRLPSPADRDGLVQRQLAVWVLPAAPGDVDRLTVHPDIAFALRISDRPGPVEPVLD